MKKVKVAYEMISILLFKQGFKHINFIKVG